MELVCTFNGAWLGGKFKVYIASSRATQRDPASKTKSIQHLVEPGMVWEEAGGTCFQTNKQTDRHSSQTVDSQYLETGKVGRQTLLNGDGERADGQAVERETGGDGRSGKKVSLHVQGQAGLRVRSCLKNQTKT